jgi:hypothetical protein
MQLARNPRHPEAGWVTCRTLFVPAGTLHYVRFNSKSIACVYLDPSSEEAVRVASVMRAKIGGLATRHHRETQVVALFEAFLRNTLRPADMLAKLVFCPKRNFSHVSWSHGVSFVPWRTTDAATDRTT